MLRMGFTPAQLFEPLGWQEEVRYIGCTRRFGPGFEIQFKKGLIE